MIVNTNSKVERVIQIKIGIIKHVSLNVKVIVIKKDYGWNPSTYTCDISKSSKSIADISVIASDETVYVMDIASTKMTNTIATRVSINSHNEEDIKLIVIFCIKFY